jgi:acyl dehydratase
MSVADVSGNAIANLGWTDIRMPAPVFHGDTLYAESEVLEARASASRPSDGVVRVETRAHKQDGTLVMRFERTVLVPRRGHGVADRMRRAAGKGETDR